MKKILSFAAILLALAFVFTSCNEPDGDKNGDKTEYWTVQFDTNGGLPATIASVEIEKGQPMGNKLPADPTRADHNFAGWYLSTDTAFATRYTAQTPAVTANITLKARWTTYAVGVGKWEAGTFIHENPDYQVTTGGQSYTAGGSRNADGSVTFLTGIAISYPFPTDFPQGTTASDYFMTIEYEDVDESVDGPAELIVKKFKTGNDIAVPAGSGEQYIDIESGDDFDCFIDDFEGATGFSLIYNEWLTGRITEFTLKITKITLTKLTETATVEFDSNGGNDIDDLIVYKGFRFTAARQPTPVKEDHSFLGWFDAVDGLVRYNQNFRIIENMTMYAQWQDESTIEPFVEIPNPTIVGGGTASNEGNVFTLAYVDTSTFASLSYTFPDNYAGWYDTITVHYTTVKATSTQQVLFMPKKDGSWADIDNATYRHGNLDLYEHASYAYPTDQFPQEILRLQLNAYAGQTGSFTFEITKIVFSNTGAYGPAGDSSGNDISGFVYVPNPVVPDEDYSVNLVGLNMKNTEPTGDNYSNIWFSLAGAFPVDFDIANYSKFTVRAVFFDVNDEEINLANGLGQMCFATGSGTDWGGFLGSNIGNLGMPGGTVDVVLPSAVNATPTRLYVQNMQVTVRYIEITEITFHVPNLSDPEGLYHEIFFELTGANQIKWGASGGSFDAFKAADYMMIFGTNNNHAEGHGIGGVQVIVQGDGGGEPPHSTALGWTETTINGGWTGVNHTPTDKFIMFIKLDTLNGYAAFSATTVWREVFIQGVTFGINGATHNNVPQERKWDITGSYLVDQEYLDWAGYAGGENMVNSGTTHGFIVVEAQ